MKQPHSKTSFSRLLPWLSMLLIISSLGFAKQVEAATLAEKVELADRLKKEALLAENQGFYDKSIELAKEIQQITGEIDDLVEIARLWYILRNRIAVAKQVRANVYAPEEYGLAIDFYNKSYQQILEEDLEPARFNIEEGLRYAELAIEKARDLFLKNQQTAIREDPLEKGTVAEELPVMEVVKLDNDLYVVRLIPQKRDCLWRIAEYEFIYNNPWKWTAIYEANRDTIKDPDLIYPGQKLVIPPIAIEPELPAATSPN